MRLASIGMLASLAVLPLVSSCFLRIDRPVCDLMDSGEKIHCAVRLPADWKERIKDPEKARALLSNLQGLPAVQPTDLQARVCATADKAQQRAYLIGSPRRAPNPTGEHETFVMAGIIDEKFNCADERYNAGMRRPTTFYFVFFTGNGKKIDETKDIEIGTWETYAFTTLSNNGISVSRDGLKSGPVVHCGLHNPPIERLIGFRTCKAASAAEKASQKLRVTVRDVYARFFSLSAGLRAQELEAAGVELTAEEKAAVIAANPEKDPLWLDCPLGCCTLM